MQVGLPSQKSWRNAGVTLGELTIEPGFCLHYNCSLARSEAYVSPLREQMQDRPDHVWYLSEHNVQP